MSTCQRTPSPVSASDHEDSQSFISANSSSTVKHNHLGQTLDPESTEIMGESDVDTGAYGTPIQRFSKEMINSLSKYKVSEDLNDVNYPTWCQLIKEVFVSMRLDKFIKVENYQDPSLSSE